MSPPQSEENPTENSLLSRPLGVDDVSIVVAGNLDHMGTLYSLLQKDEEFKEAFSKNLYTHIRLRASGDVPFEETVDRLIESGFLEETKILEFEHFDHPKLRAIPDSRVDGWHKFGLEVAGLVSQMPNLVKIQWNNTAMPASALRAIVHDCPRLQQVSGRAPHLMLENIRLDDDDDAVEHLRSWGNSMPQFSNLTSLVLYDMRGRPEQLASNIVEILINSPGLVELGLGLHPHDIIDDHVATGCVSANPEWCMTQESYADFFPRVCTTYLEKGAPQLKLQSLKLGTSMVLYRGFIEFSECQYTDNDHAEGLKTLLQFTDPESLKDLAVFNRGIVGRVGGRSHYVMGTNTHSGLSRVVDQLPHTFPNLRVLAMVVLEDDTVKSFMKLDPEYVSRLSIRVEASEVTTLAPPAHLANDLVVGAKPLPASFLDVFAADWHGIETEALWLPRISHVEQRNIRWTLGYMDSVRTLSLEVPQAGFTDDLIHGLAEMENLRHLWLRCGACSHDQVHAPKVLENGGEHPEIHDCDRETIREGHLKDVVNVSALARNLPRVRYLRVCNIGHVVILSKSPSTFPMARPLNDWEDKLEMPEFFSYQAPPTIPSTNTAEQGHYI